MSALPYRYRIISCHSARRQHPEGDDSHPLEAGQTAIWRKQDLEKMIAKLRSDGFEIDEPCYATGVVGPDGYCSPPHRIQIYSKKTRAECLVFKSVKRTACSISYDTACSK